MNWTNKIDQITYQYVTLCEDLSISELNWKPDTKTWSIGQIIVHVITLNASYFPLFDRVRAGTYSAPFLARFKFIANFMGNMLHAAVKPETKRKIKTFQIWEPSSSSLDGSIIAQFRLHQERLKSEIEKSAHLINKGIIISSPGSKMIVYRLETVFDILVSHEQRHLEQAKRLKMHMKDGAKMG